MTGDGIIFSSAVSGSPTTSSGMLAPQLLTQTANKVLAGPGSGPASTPTFRALAPADLPATISSNTTGTAATTAALAATPTQCGSNNWATGISSSGNATCLQPGFSSLAGSLAVGQTPLTTAGDLLFTNTAPALARLPIGGTNQFLGTSGGLPSWIQPTFSSLSGTATISQGGTGQTTATASFNALSPLTSEGDLHYYHSSSNTRLAIGGTNTFLASNGTDPSWGALTGAGFGSQTSNNFLAAPNGSSGNPSFRTLVAGDLPASITSNTSGNAATATALATVPSQCTGSAFALGVAAGGNANCIGSQTANYFYAAPNGSSGAPTFRALAGSDLPTIAIAGGGTGQTTAAASFNALSPLTSEGDLHYYHSSSNTRLAIGGTNTFLASNGTDPSWSSLTGAGFGTQTSNNFLAAPNGSSGNPSFRTLMAADLPASITSSTSGNAATATALATAPSQCTGSAFALGVAAGGNANCIGSQTANYFYAAPNGSSGAPTFRALAGSDFPTIAISGGGTGQTTAAASFNALSPLTSEGDLHYYHSSSNTRLAIGGTNTFLASNGTDPSWSSLTGAGFGSQTGNNFLAAPNGSSGNPSFRTLVAADLPASITSNTSGNAATATALATAPSQCAGSAFALGVAAGGNANCIGSQTANYFYAAPNGSSGAPTFRALAGSDLPMIAISGGGTGQTSATAAFNTLSPLGTEGDLLYYHTSANSRLALGSNGQCLTSNGTDPVWGSCSIGSGTVTSVGLSLPSIFSVSGSPVTGSGALTAGLANQNANLIMAGPSSGTAAGPTFRPLVGADLPAPTASTLGGVQSVICTGGQFLNQISTAGAPSCGTPTGSGSSTGLGNGATVIDATTESGTFNLEIGTAYSALPSYGGTVETRGLGGSQTMSTSISLPGGTGRPTNVILPTAITSVPSGSTWGLSSGGGLLGQGIYSSVFSGAHQSTPLANLPSGSNGVLLRDFAYDNGGPGATATNMSDSVFSNLLFYNGLSPSLQFNGANYYNVVRDSRFLQEPNQGGDVIEVLGTSNSNSFENVLPWGTGATCVYVGVSAGVDQFLHTDTEGCGMNFDFWGSYNTVLAPYQEASGATSIAWAASTSYTRGTVIKDTNGNVELCVLPGTTGGTQPTWPSANHVVGGTYFMADLFGQQTFDGSVIWEVFPAQGGYALEPGSSNNTIIGPQAASVIDASWSPWNTFLGSAENVTTTCPLADCVPSLQTARSLSSLGGLSVQGGMTLLPVILPSLTSSNFVAYPGTGSTTVQYAINATLPGGIGNIGSPTVTGLTSFYSLTNSVPRSQLGTINTVAVSHGRGYEGYSSSPLCGTGFMTGNTVRANTGNLDNLLTVTASGGCVTALTVTTTGTGNQPTYAATTTTLTGSGTGLQVDVTPYYNAILFPPLETGNGNSGYPDIKTTGYQWDVAVNSSSTCLVTGYMASGYGLQPGFLNGSVGVYFDYGQTLAGCTEPTANTTGNAVLGTSATVERISNFNHQSKTLSPFGTGLNLYPQMANSNMPFAISPSGTGTQSVFENCYNADVAETHCIVQIASSSGLLIGQEGGNPPIQTMNGSGAARNTLDDGAGNMVAKTTMTAPEFCISLNCVTSLWSDPMTTLGDLLYGGASGAATRLAGNTSTTPMYLKSVGASGVATAPTLAQIQFSDITGTLGIGAGGTGQTGFSAGLLRSSGSALSSGELSGDCTTSGSNAITCTKTNGVSFAPSATTDTTNAANVTSGVFSAAREPSTTVNSVSNDTNVTGSIAAQNLTLGWTGQLSLARGGTGQTTAATAFNALSPLTSEGDLNYYHSSSNTRLAIGGANTFITSNGSDPSWGALTGAGFGSQTANSVLAAPNGSSGNPSFRTLVAADLPASITSNTSGNAATATGLATAPSQCAGSAFALGVAASGNANCVGSQTANSVYAAPNGSSGAPTFRALAGSDLPTIAISGGGTGQTTAATAFNALSPLTSEGDLHYYHSSSNTRLAIGGANTFLTSNGTDPSWGSLTGTGFGSQTANNFLAAPNGSSGNPSFRTLVAADLPVSITSNTSGNAATATALASTPTQCSGNNFATGIAANGNANCSAPGGGQAGAYTSVTFSTTPTFTASSSTVNSWAITLTGNVTSSTLASSAAGQYLAFKICQDSTGSRSFSWPTGFSAATIVFPTASTCTEQTFFWDGSNAQPLGPAQVTGPSLSALWYGPTGGVPGTPPAGYISAWFDSTDNALKVKNSSGVITAAVGLGSCTNQVVTSVSDSAAPGCATLALASAYFANQGTTTTVLHGNAAGNPSFGSVVNGDLGANAVSSGKLTAEITYHSCDIYINGVSTGTAIVNAQLGPETRQCYVPFGATIIEMDVSADAGTPNIIIGKNHGGTISNIVSAALATAASGAIACSNSGGTLGLDGATTCGATLQNTTLARGDYLQEVSGTAGGTAKAMSVHVIYASVN
jgi:hypothetical protein